MLTKLLAWLNDQHWYIIALIVIGGLIVWIYGCESQTQSLIKPDTKVNRLELTAEMEYLAGITEARIADLDKQDAIKQSFLDALVVVGQGGQLNAAGLVNLAATIGAISWGLNRNQKLKKATASNSA